MLVPSQTLKTGRAQPHQLKGKVWPNLIPLSQIPDTDMLSGKEVGICLRRQGCFSRRGTRADSASFTDTILDMMPSPRVSMCSVKYLHPQE